MSFKALNTFVDPQKPTSDISGWYETYKEIGLERAHDKTELDLVLPDDCLVVAGPPRLATSPTSGMSVSGKDNDNFYVVGFLQGISYSETRQVQPLKAIGSRRHYFAATNAPVQGQISRLMFLGKNILHAIYGREDESEFRGWNNMKYDESNPNGSGSTSSTTTGWWANLEEDLFRIPFGLGIIYKTPRLLADPKADKDKMIAVGAEYLEGCTIQSRQIGLQSGQAMIMENVSFMADRVIPFSGYRGLQQANYGDVGNSNAVPR